MNRKSWASSSRAFSVLLIAVCASLIAGSPLQAVEMVAQAPAAQLPDGIWSVQGRAIQGRRQCGDWFVRLTNRQGQLSGVLSLARSSVPIHDLALQPDGSFSASTRAGVVGTTHARAYKITGKFSGDRVGLTLEDNICPPRHGTAVRQARGGQSGCDLLKCFAVGSSHMSDRSVMGR